MSKWGTKKRVESREIKAVLNVACVSTAEIYIILAGKETLFHLPAGFLNYPQQAMY